MKATATTDFKASIGGCQFNCEAGDEVEADAATIEKLEAIGLVKTESKRGGKPRKAAKDD